MQVKGRNKIPRLDGRLLFHIFLIRICVFLSGCGILQGGTQKQSVFEQLLLDVALVSEVYSTSPASRVNGRVSNLRPERGIAKIELLVSLEIHDIIFFKQICLIY